MSYLTYEIEARWVADTLTPAQIGAKTIEMLRRLEPLAPAMNNWTFAEGPDFKPLTLADVAPRMASLVAGSLAWQSSDGPSDPVYGYSIGVSGAAKQTSYGAPDVVEISVQAGGQVGDSIEFQIGAPNLAKDYSLITYPVYCGSLEAIAATWPLPWAIAYTWSADSAPIDAPASKGKRPSPFEVAWIAYLSPPLALDLEPPPEIVAEPTPGGGVILSAVQTLIDPSNPDHMRRSRALQGIMTERVGTHDRWPGPAWHAPREGPY